MIRREALFKFISNWLILAGLIFLFPVVNAQPEIIRFERFSDEEGLPNNVFKYILQDRDGIIWMGGKDGLASYDGYSISSFRHSHFDSSSISGNSISAIYEDSKGRLWLGLSGSGVNVSDITKTSFTKVRVFDDPLRNASMNVSDITEDKLGRIWLASDLGLFIISEESEKFICNNPHELWNQLSFDEVIDRPVSLFSSTDNKVWIGTESGLYMYDPDQDRWYPSFNFIGIPSGAIQDIEYDRNGRVWVSVRNEGPRMFYADKGSNHFKPFVGIPFQSLRREIHFTFDLDNRLWATVFGEQAYAYDFRDSTLFLQSNINSDISHEIFFRKPFVDHSGNTWLPCEGFYIFPFPKGFHTYQHPFAFHQSNSSIYGDEKFLWMAYREKGIVRIEKTTGQTTLFHKDGDNDFKIPVNHIQDILKVKSGNLILVGFANIAVMNPEGRIIYSHKLNGTNRAAFEDSFGRIWIGGYGGLHLFSEKHGVLKTYKLPARGEDESNLIQSIVEDRHGNIWFASDMKGLGMVNPETDKVKQFIPEEGNNESLPSLSIVDLAVDKNQDILWLATDVALVRLDPVSFALKYYDKSNGLKNDYISSLICTKGGLIWLSTHAGITSFDPQKEVFVNYSSGDGLTNFSYYNTSKFHASDGTLYFGGKNGVDYFHPSQLRANPTQPLMLLSSLAINHKKKLSLYDLKKSDGKLELTYNEDLIEIEIAGVHFSNQNEVRYEYRMDGIDDDWVDLGQQRNILFSGLKPGDYVFRARAMSGDQVWTEKELSIPIHIKPPFYGTTWFRIMIGSLILGTLIFIIKTRERSIKKKEKQEAEVNRKITELEKRALQAQMNPHFIYNSMNSIQQFMIVHDVEGAMKYLTKFSRILRTVLNISSQSRIPLSDEIKLIEDYLELENMRFPNKFAYTINVSPDINIHTAEIPPFFIQPQVENAVRHGLLKKTGQGFLKIDIDGEGPYLHITVEDNGVGREAAKRAKYQDTAVRESKGLSIVEERLAYLHSGNGYNPFRIVDLFDSSNEAAGTRVEITLPLD